MIKKNNTETRSQKRFSDLVGVDFATTATKVVRLKKNKTSCTLSDLELLPAVDFSVPGSFQFPKRLAANYGCLAYSGEQSVIRMVNSPLAEGAETLPEAKLRELLNVNADFRVSVKLTKRAKGRQDSSFLAAAIPQHDLRYMLDLFSAGPPAAASVEVAGLSFVTAFLHAQGNHCAEDSVCLLDTGERSSHFVFLHKNSVSLVGKLSFGIETVRKQIAADLGVDQELAGSILADRSINISASLRSVLEPYMKQLSISMDFLQRHQGNRISKVFLSGGMSLISSWQDEVGRMMKPETATWNPLENIEYDAEALPKELVAQSTRFAAAIGAAIGGME